MRWDMKKKGLIIGLGVVIALIVAGGLIVKNFVKVDKENGSVQIIGGADGPTSIFIAGKIPDDNSSIEDVSIMENEEEENEEVAATMKLKIDGVEVPVTWEENDSVSELTDLKPITIEMSKYGGFEQVGPIGKSITSNDKKITTSYGDIVLYADDQIVVFYGSNTWEYTKLGHIDMTKEELTDLLGNKNVTIVLE
jgi:hypothetical protein